ncbi:MAG: hypothetical protein DCC71_09435 [Proteobacteria bacterium]|nr:MAG: hypothetical protein DCC71_09435 [Pseudomonadota bacterium]
MSAGRLARALLPERIFARAAESYRALFVDLDAVVDCLPAPPPGAEILDVGGGDGAVLDRLLARHPGVRATLLDLAPRVGAAIAPERRERVRLLAATRLADARARGVPAPDWVMLSDVLHHVPRGERDALLGELRALVGERPITLVVKDVAPGGLRSRMSVLADRWISGDRGVELLAPGAAIALVQRAFPRLAAHETALLRRDPPNYCVVFAAGGAAARPDASGRCSRHTTTAS